MSPRVPALTLLLALPALASPQTAPEMIVVRNADGGVQTPTAEERARLAAQLRSALVTSPGHELILRPDGVKQVRIHGFLRFSVVRKGADGKPESGCFSSVDAAAAFLQGSGPSITRAEK